MDIHQLIDELPDSESTTTELLDAEIAHSGPCCDKCGAPLSAKESLVCNQCGWYASIGSYVEIDKSWEVAADPELTSEADALPVEKAKLPTWAWILTGCLVTVFAESVAARFVTSEGSTIRTFWSLAQLFVGFVAFTICHTYCFLLVLKNEADIKILDYFLRPINSWSIIFRGMPERGWVCYVGLSGLTAVAMSLLVIGAIPYERLLDWGVEEKAKSNLLGAAIAHAKNAAAQEEQSMEDALGDFAGKAGVDDLKKANAAKNKREKQDCIIMGYMANQGGEIQTLLLAAEHYAKLTYAGNVRFTGLSPVDLDKLTRQLAANKTHKPLVRVSIDGAIWVKPKYLCRVSFRRRGKQGGMFGAKLEGLLGKVDLKDLLNK